jgi:uncharacterized protein (TIGR02001 family)
MNELVRGIGTAILATSVLLPFGASAAEKSKVPGTFSANVGLVSEYYFRGISQNDDKPALQGGFDYEISLAKPVMAYVGVWGSNVDFNEGTGVDGASIEINYYGCLKGNIGDSGVGWDVGFIYYSYPGAARNLSYDFIEAQAALSYDFGVAAETASVNWSLENLGDRGKSTYPKLTVDVPVSKTGLTLSSYVARQNIEKNATFGSPDYTKYNLSVGYNLVGFDLYLAYSDTSISPSGDGNEEAALFSVSRSL